MVYRSLDTRIVAEAHGQQNVEQGRGIAEHPTPGILSSAPKRLGHVDQGLKRSVCGLAGQHRAHSLGQIGIVGP